MKSTKSLYKEFSQMGCSGAKIAGMVMGIFPTLQIVRTSKMSLNRSRVEVHNYLQRLDNHRYASGRLRTRGRAPL